MAAQECEGVHFLENGSVEIGGVRFIGCTLWTDFALDGLREVPWAPSNYEGRITDSKAIAWRRLPAYEGFGSRRVVEPHQRSRRFLQGALAEPFGGPTVVVTHHAPHSKSVHPRWKGSSLNASFASDLSEVIEAGRPALWIHGHMHDSSDYRVSATRVICNPKGYYSENTVFDPRLVVGV